MRSDAGRSFSFVFWISLAYCKSLHTASGHYTYLMRRAEEDKLYIFHNDRITFNTIQTKILRLLEEIHSERFGKEAQIPLCVNDLILHVNRIFYEKDRPASERMENSLYEKLLVYMEEHIDEDLSLIDGGLVGGASLKADFGKIVNYK